MSRIRRRIPVLSKMRREAVDARVERNLVDECLRTQPAAAANCAGGIEGLIAELGNTSHALAVAHRSLHTLANLGAAPYVIDQARGRLDELVDSTSVRDIAQVVADAKVAAVDQLAHQQAADEAVEVAVAAMADAGLTKVAVEASADGSVRITAQTVHAHQFAEVTVETTAAGAVIASDVATPSDAVYPLHPRAADPCQPSIELAARLETLFSERARALGIELGLGMNIDPPTRGGSRRRARNRRSAGTNRVRKNS